MIRPSKVVPILRATLLALCPLAVFSQVPVPLSFEVASIKPSMMLAPRDQSITSTGIVYTNVTLVDCIEAAWGVRRYQISGPEWLRSDKYDIIAKAGGVASKTQLMLMLRALLADRFGLTVHRETKDRAIYVLVLGKDGPRFQAAGSSYGTGSTFVEGGMAFRRMSMAGFADYLAGLDAIDRPVLDRTGLNGEFDFTLRLFEARPDMTGFDKKFAMKGAEHIFTDLQEQLGLKLDSIKAPVEILVIDHAEKIPSSN
ncbi:MAG TPA: TIGR03435 family protein [Bryobacteraceae bacterium]|jgi:uncharacterized protein (TIGR03435 family)|nr:TIGR03435 family protein [Bryobacteraceae bacterium]